MKGRDRFRRRIWNRTEQKKGACFSHSTRWVLHLHKLPFTKSIFFPFRKLVQSVLPKRGPFSPGFAFSFYFILLTSIWWDGRGKRRVWSSKRKMNFIIKFLNTVEYLHFQNFKAQDSVTRTLVNFSLWLSSFFHPVPICPLSRIIIERVK